ncbi:MAG TPA: BON domain-containing protein [Steroidobacteraceae bacterium]|jgi:hyperosmotically inducible protein|nr:BON domain-containing protein [Steroidobacteraceae bacterium]
MKQAAWTARVGLVIVALALGACSATRTQQSAGEVVDDSVLTAKVKTALIEDPVTKAGQIDVETYRGVVQLAGVVDSQEAKARAVELARAVSGVQEVRNDLRVGDADQSVGQTVDDGVITTQVKAKLIADSRTDAYKINVDTQGGVVQLSGFVDNDEAKRTAGEVARSVSGVRDVDNDLEIRKE